MASVIKIVDRQTVDAIAVAWLAQLDGGELSPADLAAFREWVNRSPEHRRTLIRAAQSWSRLDDVIEARLADALGDETGAAPGLTGALVRLYPVRSAAAIAACLAVLLAAAFVAVADPFGFAPAPQKVVYASSIGEQRTMTLEDGTVVRLNTESSLEVDFSPAERSVRLLEGEAWFDVAHNTKRPFVVYAGDGAVRAVGTSFAVRKRADIIDVTVTAGRVVLSNMRRDEGEDESPFPLATLEAGHKASFDSQVESVERLETSEIERKLAWRDGFLRFDGDPLADVVDEISRYTTVNIVIADPALQNVRVGGYFETGDLETLLEILNESFGVAHDWRGENEVRLSVAE